MVSIPHILHQFWLGGPPPASILWMRETWRKYHPHWDCRWWTEENLAALPRLTGDKYKEGTSFAQQVDILRYEALYHFGGIYADADFECLRPFDPLLEDVAMFVCDENGAATTGCSNGLIGAVPEHPALYRVLEGLKDKPLGLTNLVYETGPRYFRSCFRDDEVTWIPQCYFYPYPSYMRGKMPPRKHFAYAYAVHHWAASWDSDQCGVLDTIQPPATGT